MSNAKPDKRIRVLRIIARLNTGGPATHAILLNSGLDETRFKSHLVTGTVSGDERDMIEEARKKGVEPVVIPELKRELSLISDIRAFFKLYWIIRRLKPDIVHTHTAKAGTLGRLAAWLNHVPVKIHTFHGHVFHSYFGRLKTALFLAIEKTLAKFTDSIVVISPEQLKEIKDKYKVGREGKHHIIPLGLNLEPFLKPAANAGLREELSLGRSTLLVGVIGRLVSVKNHRMFLEAAKKVKVAWPGMKVKFLIVGDGSLRGDLEAYARKLGIDRSVVFTGWRSDLSVVYEALDIVCITSLNEGTPISLIEAMASGKAVVSTDVGGVRDIVTHNETGLLSPSRDAEAFSKNLLELLLDEDKRAGMGREGRKFVSRKYSKKRLISDMEFLYWNELNRKYDINVEY